MMNATLRGKPDAGNPHVRFKLLALLGLAVASVTLSASAMEFHVAVGDDLADAVAKAVKYRRDHRDEAVTVCLASGDYPCPKAIRLSPDHGFVSSVNAPFTICAEEGARPRLLGASVVSGWTRTELNGRRDVWVADVAKIANRPLDLFFYDGRSMDMCRYPNWDAAHPYSGGWAYVDGVARNMYQDFPDDDEGIVRQKPKDVRKWSDPSEGRLNIFPRYNWWNSIHRISSVSNGFLVLKDRIRQGFATRAFDRYHVMGYREELDAPGEWYHDAKGGKLYFIPPDGKSPERCVTSVPTDVALFALGNCVTNVVFSGLEICSAANGIIADGRVDRVTVIGCRLHDIGFIFGDAVRLGGTHNVVRDCDIWNIGSYGVSISRGWKAPPPRPDRYDKNLVLNNYIHHTGRINRHGFGVNVYGNGARVAHNLIHDMPRGGIFYSGTFLYLDHNRIRHCNLEMEDTACIYGGGFCGNVGLKMNYNHVSDSIGFSHDNTGKYHFRKKMGWGLYLDDCSGGAEVVGNLVEHCNGGAMHVHCARFNLISNNVFVACGGLSTNPRQFSIQGWPSPSPRWTNYLEVAQQRQYEWMLKGSPAWTNFPALAIAPAKIMATAPDHLVMQGNRILCNILYYPDEPKSLYTSPGYYNVKNNVFDYNIIYSGGEKPRVVRNSKELKWFEWTALGQDVHSLWEDPKFRNPERGDYRFASGSPARKLGFAEEPWKGAGLFVNEVRKKLPVEAEGVREHPEWLVE